MSDVTAPLQSRSRRTFETLLEATETLLEDRAFEEISVGEIVAAAGASTGSFYARFASKEALLPVLYERYEQRIAGEADALVEKILKSPTLLDACRQVTDSFAEIYRTMPFLMRAVTRLAREKPDTPREISPQRQRIHLEIEAALMHFSPPAKAAKASAAVRSVMFMASCTLRERLLYPHAPLAAQSRPSDDFTASVAKMMAAYLKEEWS